GAVACPDSFPTRRSSDLDAVGLEAVRRRADGVAGVVAGAVGDDAGVAGVVFLDVEDDLHQVGADVGDLREDASGDAQRGRAERLDRKSTRLNSSHRTISY